LKSVLKRRILGLEPVAMERPSGSERISQRSFLAKVEQRRRMEHETFEESFQHLVAQLQDHELEALIVEVEATIPKDDNSKVCGIEGSATSAAPNV
jgi:hypothetical protein